MCYKISEVFSLLVARLVLSSSLMITNWAINVVSACSDDDVWSNGNILVLMLLLSGKCRTLLWMEKPNVLAKPIEAMGNIQWFLIVTLMLARHVLTTSSWSLRTLFLHYSEFQLYGPGPESCTVP